MRTSKIIPKESWHLMDFDDYDFKKDSEVVSDSQLHHQADNSIVVNVIYELLKSF